MSGADMYHGWSRLDFRTQTGAKRMLVCPKRGAGLYNIFKLVPTARGTCTTYRGHLYRSYDKPAPSIPQTCAIEWGKRAMSNTVLADSRVVRCTICNEQHGFAGNPRYSLHHAGKDVWTWSKGCDSECTGRHICWTWSKYAVDQVQIYGGPGPDIRWTRSKYAVDQVQGVGKGVFAWG